MHNIYYGFTSYCVYLPENEVDGEAFLLLSDDQIKALVPPIGPQMKLIAKRSTYSSTTEPKVSENMTAR